MKYLFLCCLGLFMLFNLYQWHRCQGFGDHYFFSKYKIQLSLDDAIHNDTNIPFILIRFVHNKPVFALKSIFDTWLLYWDIKYIFTLFTPVGVLGLLFGFCQLFNLFVKARTKKPLLLGILIITLCLPFLTLFTFVKIHFYYQLIILSFPIFFLSLYGWNIFLSPYIEKRMVFGAVLFWLSLLWIVGVPSELGWICQL